MLAAHNKRKIFFYLTLDPHRKKLFGKHFCYSLLKMKNYPELEKDEILMQINKLELSKISDVIEGKFYIKDSDTVFELDKEISNNCTKNIKIENNYDPLYQIEKSKEIEDLQYEKLNVFKYFSHYNNFIEGFNNNVSYVDKEKENLKLQNEKINTFIKCLCKIYIGHNIHQKIKNEISKITNLYILKGDYFSSLGYYTVSQIGNPLLIRFYSKIAENFARVFLISF